MIKGKQIYLSLKDPIVSSIAEPIKRLNVFFDKHFISLGSDFTHEEDKNKVDLPTFTVFRGFNNGNLDGHGFRKGGRMYADGGHYQQLRRDSRKGLRIDGEACVEVDIHACYLTLAYALLGKPLPDSDDLYTIDGVGRDGVKAFVNNTLSAGKPPKLWSRDHCERYDKDDLTRFRRDYPIKTVSPAILAAMPILTEANKAGIDWADLIYHESEIMLSTILDLAFVYDICALPMHDGLIVPVRHKEQAKSSLSKAFHDRMGAYPIIKVK